MDVPAIQFEPVIRIVVDRAELPERQRQHPDLYVPTGQQRGYLRGEEMRIRARDVYVAIDVDPQRIDDPLPPSDILDLVQYYVEPPEVLFRNNLIVEYRSVAVSVVPDGFHVIVEDVRVRDPVFLQQFDVLLQQRGFPASSDAGDDLDHVLVLEPQKLIEVASSEHIPCHDRDGRDIIK